MLLYDNRGRLRLICQIYGSIYKRVAFPVVGMVAYSVGLLFVRRLFDEYLPAVDHPFASQSFGTLIAFAVCFRTNIAWNRFWEACQEVTMMFSKWGDAFSQLQGFINSTIKIKPDCDVEKLEHYRCEITHMFTLLSAMAVERLSRGDIRRMEMRRRKGVPWAEQVVFRENLRAKDLTGSRNLIPIRIVKVRREKRSSSHSSLITEEDLSESESESDSPKRLAVVPSVSKISIQLKQMKDSWQMPVSIIGDLSKEELKRLRSSKDRINLVLLWVNELVTNLQPLILVPPPILSRVYQELSNGTLGYSQAEKLSDIPFPFIFAQLLAVTIIFFAAVAPITFTVITGDSWITPVISSGVVIAFWSLNEIAKELENPFGEDANNLPLVDAHERFVEFLVEMHGTTLPEDREYASMRTSPSTVYSRDSSSPKRSYVNEGPVETQMGGVSPTARAAAGGHLKSRTRDISSIHSESSNTPASSSSQKRVFPSTYSEQPEQRMSTLMLPACATGHAQHSGTGGHGQQDHYSTGHTSHCVMPSMLEHSNLIDESPRQAQPVLHEPPPLPVRNGEEGSHRWPDEGRYAKASGVDLRIDEEHEQQEEQRDEKPAGQAGNTSMTSVVPNQVVADQAASTSTSTASHNMQRPVQDAPTTSDRNSALGVPPSDRCSMNDQRLLS